MKDIHDKLKEISDKIDEQVVAVKGTLDLADASLMGDEVHPFLLKAIERMDYLQELSDELVGVIDMLLKKIEETKPQ